MMFKFTEPDKLTPLKEWCKDLGIDSIDWISVS